MPRRVRRSTIRAGQHDKSRPPARALVYARLSRVDRGELPRFRLARDEAFRAEVEPFVAGSQCLGRWPIA